MTSTMSAASRTRSIDSWVTFAKASGLVTKLSRHRQLLELAYAEAVRHSGEVVRHPRREVVASLAVPVAEIPDGLRALEVMMEEGMDHFRDPGLFPLRRA